MNKLQKCIDDTQHRYIASTENILMTVFLYMCIHIILRTVLYRIALYTSINCI